MEFIVKQLMKFKKVMTAVELIDLLKFVVSLHFFIFSLLFIVIIFSLLNVEGGRLQKPTTFFQDHS